MFIVFSPQRRAELKVAYLVGYLGVVISFIVYAKFTERRHSEIATATPLGCFGTI